MNRDLIDAFSESGFSICRYYCIKVGRIPNTRSFSEIDAEKLLEIIKKQYPQFASEMVHEQRYSYKSKRYKTNLFIYHITADIVLYYDPPSFGKDRIEIDYSESSDKVILDDVCNLILKHRKENSANSSIHLLCLEHGSLALKPFQLNVPDIDIQRNYNDDFAEVHDQVVEYFNRPNEKGIVLLHGEPGNGKTTYVRYLATILEKRLIYIPPDLANRIASPEFLPQLIDYPNSILVIEDAENILKERQGGDNASISNLLNLSDGLLSDCLNIQLLCSFNADISRIDKALLRKGRIIAKYEFTPLKKNKAQSLAYHLGQKRIIEKDLSLAEIYNPEGMEYLAPKSTIGFVG